MKKVITTEKVPIKLWLDDIEDGALEQAKNLANLPFIFKHVALMPDSHQGYGMPIGGVVATKKVIIPNAVGVDINCGMRAVRTNLVEIDRDTLLKIMGDIREKIPVGFKHHTEMQDDWYEGIIPDDSVVAKEYHSSLYQIGTLGGGNHFIEIQKGSDEHIWIMVHSGSRNIGYKVAQYYNKVAIGLNKKWFSEVPPKWQLAFLPLDSEEGKHYFAEMKFCMYFAEKNRELMINNIKNCIINHIDNVEFDDDLDVPHNYASIENHFGKNVIVHRKGATKAYKGRLGIIPGSQGTASYIVEGKGNKDSFMSCSHGAGRRMGRKQAQRELNFEEEVNKLDKLGIIHSIRHTTDLDEAPSAYKDISTVMENQKDLVDIKIELKPLAVIKG